jgi:hypothetical protein
MGNPITPKERLELEPLAIQVECPRCKVKPGERCVYAKFARRKGTTHDIRLHAAKQARTSKYGLMHGHNHEDLRPIASRRLTIREERDAGVWHPVKEET